MNYTEQAIKDAVEKGGYKHPYMGTAVQTIAEYGHHQVALLDPAFWECLGKARAWENIKWNAELISPRKILHKYGSGYLYHWHRFIDHLADGHSTEQFFEILK
jgi:hypothetical protein